MESNRHYWLKAVIFWTLMSLLYTEAVWTHAKLKEKALVFRGSALLRVLFGGVIVLFAALLVKDAQTEETWVLVLGTACIVGISLAWPATIIVNDVGVERRRWWKRAVRIPWNEVTAIERDGDHNMAVFGNNGQSITFTKYHVDPFRFQEEVMRRAKLKKVLDGTAPITLRE